jgi:hypothetical protein
MVSFIEDVKQLVLILVSKNDQFSPPASVVTTNLFLLSVPLADMKIQIYDRKFVVKMQHCPVSFLSCQFWGALKVRRS